MYDPEQAFALDELFENIDSKLEELFAVEWEGEANVPPEKYADLQKCKADFEEALRDFMEAAKEIKDQYVSAFDPDEKIELGEQLLKLFQDLRKAFNFEE